MPVHWHGLLIPGEVDGGPHQPIAPQQTWQPQLPIDQSRAFLWFHTHIHGETAEAVHAGSVERWVLGGEMMGHPFHIHGVRFLVVRDKGGEPRPENRGWKDTVFVDGEIELLVQFRDPAPASAPFMFHCHVLEHEDRGMMGQYTVS